MLISNNTVGAQEQIITTTDKTVKNQNKLKTIQQNHGSNVSIEANQPHI